MDQVTERLHTTETQLKEEMQTKVNYVSDCPSYVYIALLSYTVSTCVHVD